MSLSTRFGGLSFRSHHTGRRRTRRRIAFPSSIEALEERLVMSADILVGDPGPSLVGQPEVRADARPNFVFILTDDQDVATLDYMPRVQELLVNQGVTFENMFVTNPLCCPSNVSILTGQYSHNTGILHNVPPQGGFQKFVDMRTDGDPNTLGDETTLATWLQDAGYFTGRIGKYLVGYNEPNRPPGSPDNSTYIPPGWDEWFGTYGGAPGYYNYGVNDNGTVIQFGNRPEDYSTDVLTNRVVSFIDQAEENDDQPFFALFAASTPHAQAMPNGAPIPAPRHQGTFAGATAPRTPSFNEADVSDKPPHIANLPPLSAAQMTSIDRQYQARLESLQSLDEGVEQIINALAERGELDNTYIFFTSDNGYHLGQHRLFQGKGEAYEEDIRVPLLVRGPGVRPGVTLDHMALNIDFAPTIVELAGATAGRVMDGQSLAPLIVRDTPPPQNWRHDFLVEIYRNPPMQPGSPGFALRTRHELYVEYADGFRELYDLRTDPYQLNNLADVADQGHLKNLSRRLAELVNSSGPSRHFGPSQSSGHSHADGPQSVEGILPSGLFNFHTDRVSTLAGTPPTTVESVVRAASSDSTLGTGEVTQGSESDDDWLIRGDGLQAVASSDQSNDELDLVFADVEAGLLENLLTL